MTRGMSGVLHQHLHLLVSRLATAYRKVQEFKKTKLCLLHSSWIAKVLLWKRLQCVKHIDRSDFLKKLLDGTSSSMAQKEGFGKRIKCEINDSSSCLLLHDLLHLLFCLTRKFSKPHADSGRMLHKLFTTSCDTLHSAARFELDAAEKLPK